MNVVFAAIFSLAAAGLPDGWIFQPHREYQPTPKCRCDIVDGEQVLRVEDIKGPNGSLFGPDLKIPAVSGRSVLVKAAVRGEGGFSVSLARFTAAGKWNWRTRSVKCGLTPEWKEHTFEIPVEDTPVGKTAEVMVWMEAEKNTGWLEIKNASWYTRSLALPGSVEMEMIETFDRDDYDTPRNRPGCTKMVKGDFLPGIPKQVNRGRYEYSSPRHLTLSKRRYPMPDASAGEFFVFGIRVYRLENSSASFVFGTSPEHVRRIDFPPVEEKKLPADFIFAVDADGSYTRIVKSLADMTTVRRSGFDEFFRGVSNSFVAAVALKPEEGGRGLAELDEFFAARARNTAASPIPIKVTPEETFDPVEKKWPLVFSDDFDGKRLDEGKWFIPSWMRKDADTVTLDGKGNLRILAEPDREKGVLRTSGIWTRKNFRYGYFEARLKFTYLPGWCAAFWLYGLPTKNPLVDGIEIDIFEDYPTRWNGKKPCNSHNLHNNTPHEAAKSWSFLSPMPDDRDFHVIGCKWTPFEISEYLDGRLIRTVERGEGRDGVVFDALTAAVCNAPLHLVLSGNASKSSRGKVDFDAFPFPESFTVDRVRVYAWPDEKNGPAVSWRGNTSARTVRRGESLRFSVEARPGTSKVKNVYLFDNGYPVASKSAPPYDFEIPFTLEHYRTTLFMKPGRSGVPPSFDDHIHAFAAFAEDENGVVTSTESILRIPEPVVTKRIWDGKRLGTVRSTDCFTYVAGYPNESRRTLVLRYSVSPETKTDYRCKVLVGGVEKGEFRLPATGKALSCAELPVVIPAGRSEILFVPIGVFTVHALEIK